jgi:peroxiredoxin
MKRFFFLLFTPLLSFAQNGAKEFELKGKLNLSKSVDRVYLRYSSGDQYITDSAKVKNGAFNFKGKIPEPTVAGLVVKYAKQDGEEKAQREATQIFIEPSKMEFVTKDSLKSSFLTGSKGEKDFKELIKKVESYDFEPLYASYSDYQKKADKEGMSKIEKQIEELENKMNEDVYLGFLKSKPNSPVALYALKQYAGYDIDAAKVEPLFKNLPANQKAWPSAVAFNERIVIAKKTGIGNYAMDFTQNDTLNRPVSLSSFRGQYVLVDFWASWCGPCRRENPNIVEAYNKFKESNFTILGVSLDKNPEAWKKAIIDDNLSWTHISDLKYWQSEVVPLYGFQSIPFNVLVDPAGKVIAENLRGSALEDKLSAVLEGKMITRTDNTVKYIIAISAVAVVLLLVYFLVYNKKKKIPVKPPVKNHPRKKKK